MTRNYAPTAEQKQAAKERREKFSQMTKAVAAMSESERAALSAKILVLNTAGHTLSPTNQMLIAYQCPNPTIVGGFHQWQLAGRKVRKGEHGLCIWIPRTQKEDPDRKEGEISSTDKPGFFMGTVFDISQTEAAQ